MFSSGPERDIAGYRTQGLIQVATSRIGMTDYTTVSIPKELGDRVEETIEGTSFT